MYPLCRGNVLTPSSVINDCLECAFKLRSNTISRYSRCRVEHFLIKKSQFFNLVTYTVFQRSSNRRNVSSTRLDFSDIKWQSPDGRNNHVSLIRCLIHRMPREKFANVLNELIKVQFRRRLAFAVSF